MRKKPTQNETEAAGTAVAAANNTQLSTAVDNAMFAQDAGQGMENASAESFAIPFVSVLQKGSPQVDEASGAAIEGAKAGMFFENVTGRMYDGKQGISIVPCSYKRVFIRWGAKDIGGGFKGEIAPEDIAEMRARGEIKELDGQLLAPAEDGTVNPKKSDVFKDTRNHYILLVDNDTGAWTEALLSLTSTQIKKSKMLMSALASVKVKGAAGLFTPPTFANVVSVKTLGESNDKGTWFGVKFELSGFVSRPEIYAAAKAFHASVAKGAVTAKYEEDVAGAPEQQGTGF